MEKLTPWFDKNTKPVHIGIYERDYNDGETAYNYWNGKFWGLYSKSRFGATHWKDLKAHQQNLPWRGIFK